MGRGMKVYSNGPGHMIKMATIPIIYGKMLKRPMILKLGMQHRVLEYYQVCSNDDPGLTMTYFTARSNLVPYAFVWEKSKTMDFSETVVVYVLYVLEHNKYQIFLCLIELLANKMCSVSFVNQYIYIWRYIPGM